MHVGLVRASAPTSGTGLLPPAGIPFETVNSLSSPAVSSWFFGTGAKWLNQEVSSFEGGIAPLDVFLTEGAGTRTRGRVFGGRIARALTGRVDVELAVDASSGSYGLTSATLAGLQATATSFFPVWNAILGQNLPSASGTAILSGTTDPGDQIFATAAVNVYSHHGRFSPYVTGGAGVAINHGGVAAALDGNIKYQLGPFAKSETDAVTVDFSQVRTEPVVVLGIGFTQDTSPRTGIRVDLRAYLSRNPDRTVLSALPSTTGTPTVEDYLALGQANLNVLQFSGVSGTPSTLSVPVSNFTTYAGTGVRVQATFLVGVFVRF